MNTEQEEKHALSNVVLTAPWVWQTWKDEWRKSQPLDQRVSMIHSVFWRELQPQEYTELVCLLLEIADQHDVSKSIENPKDWPGIQDFGNRKYELSRKAMIMLCNAFFSDNYHGDRAILSYQEPLFSKLLWFFRRRDRWTTHSNFSPQYQSSLGEEKQEQHYLSVCRKFIKEFTITAWDFTSAWRRYRNHPSELREGIHANTQTHWKEILDLMERADALDHLMEHPPIRRRYHEMVQFFLQRGLPPKQRGVSLSYPETLTEAMEEYGGLTKLGDFLWIIAPRYREEGISIEADLAMV